MSDYWLGVFHALVFVAVFNISILVLIYILVQIEKNKRR